MSVSQKHIADPATIGQREIQSPVLGELVVPEDAVITMADGLFGFPDAHEFVLLPFGREGMFWLQSVDFPALVFLLADPFLFVSGYSVDVSPGALGSEGESSAADLAVLGIMSMPETPGEPPTLNLQGPLVFDLARKVAKQIALDESSYGLRFPVHLAALAAAS